MDMNAQWKLSAEAVFTRLGLKRPLIWPHFLFFRSLSRSDFSVFSKDEIEAVLFHEAGHIVKHHLRDRLLMGAGIAIGCTIMGVFTALSIETLTAERHTGPVILGFGTMMLVLQTLCMRWLARRQEIEADAFAVIENKIPLESFERGLAKIKSQADQKNRNSERIRVLKTKIKTAREVAPALSLRRIRAKTAWGAVWCSTAIALFFLVARPVQQHMDLVTAIQNQDVPEVQELLKEGASPNGSIKRWFGPTPLQVAAETGNAPILALLLERGANPNLRGYNGYTPVMRAASHNQLEAMRYLISRGADPTLKNNQGATALDLAREFGAQEAQEALASLPHARSIASH